MTRAPGFGPHHLCRPREPLLMCLPVPVSSSLIFPSLPDQHPWLCCYFHGAILDLSPFASPELPPCPCNIPGFLWAHTYLGTCATWLPSAFSPSAQCRFLEVNILMVLPPARCPAPQWWGNHTLACGHRALARIHFGCWHLTCQEPNLVHKDVLQACLPSGGDNLVGTVVLNYLFHMQIDSCPQTLRAGVWS